MGIRGDMNLIIAMLEFFGGGFFFGWLRRRQYLKVEQELGRRKIWLDQRESHLTWKENALKNVPKPDPLIRITVEDAIHREQRAKAALTALLRSNGCTEDQICEVINSVDGSEEGDLT